MRRACKIFFTQHGWKTKKYREHGNEVRTLCRSSWWVLSGISMKTNRALKMMDGLIGKSIAAALMLKQIHFEFQERKPLYMIKSDEDRERDAERMRSTATSMVIKKKICYCVFNEQNFKSRYWGNKKELVECISHDYIQRGIVSPSRYLELELMSGSSDRQASVGYIDGNWN